MLKKKDNLKKIVVIIFIIFLNVIFIKFQNDNYLFKSKNVYLIEDEWEYENELISLDKKLNLEANDSYTIETNYSVISGEYLLLRSSLSNVEVFIDNKIIYKKTYESIGFIKKPIASLWHLVEIPKDGQNIKIKYQSPYKKMNGLLNPVVYGQRGDLLFYIFNQYGLSFVIDIILLFLGLIMLVISYVNPKENYINIWNVGLFSVLAASWLLAESRMLQFFTDSQWILGSVAYICLALIPIPFIKYIKNFISDKNSKSFNIILRLCWFNLILIVFMQIFDVKDFFETIWITHGTMGIIIVITFKQLYYEIKNKNNKIAKYFSVTLSILFVFTVISFIAFYFFDGRDITLFIRLGIILFVIMLSIETRRQWIYLIKKSYKSEFYEKLAFLDQLTQGSNRMAFENDFGKIFKNDYLLKHLRLVILDMNQLKKINDVYGHVVGDEAIKKAYELINSHFSDLGKTYRIGGDEFACIIIDDVPNKFKYSCEMFSSSIIKENKKTPYHMGISLGSVTYDSTKDTSIKKMVHRADNNMYQDKKENILE